MLNYDSCENSSDWIVVSKTALKVGIPLSKNYRLGHLITLVGEGDKRQNF
jgi:hypothetical protein